MLGRRTIRLVAILLVVLLGLVCILGYNFVYDRNVRPEEKTLLGLLN